MTTSPICRLFPGPEVEGDDIECDGRLRSAMCLPGRRPSGVQDVHQDVPQAAETIPRRHAAVCHTSNNRATFPVYQVLFPHLKP